MNEEYFEKLKGCVAEVSSETQGLARTVFDFEMRMELLEELRKNTAAIERIALAVEQLAQRQQREAGADGNPETSAPAKEGA